MSIKKNKLTASDYHELIMVLLAGIMVATLGGEAVMVWNNAGFNEITTRNWIYLGWGVFAFTFFTRQHIKMKKVRAIKHKTWVGSSSDSSSDLEESRK